MTLDFRYTARRSLQRAKAELSASDDHRLYYAALEIRFAMEAITYGRMYAYRDHIPPSEYRTWQPRKVFEMLLEIDPNVSTGVSLAVGVEQKYGVPAEEMQSLGTEIVLTKKNLKEHYDAIGSYLHVPTLAQVDNNDRNLVKLRNRCEQCIIMLESILSSPIWNVKFGKNFSFNCFRCNVLLTRWLPLRKVDAHDVRCLQCGAEYAVTETNGGKISVNPKWRELHCPNPECSDTIGLWSDEITSGTRWSCESCGNKYILKLIVENIRAESEP